MDAVVYTQGQGIWRVSASPSMRGLGDVLKGGDKTLTIVPDEGSDLDGIRSGPYASLDEVMAAVGHHIGGRCRPAGRGRAGGFW